MQSHHDTLGEKGPVDICHSGCVAHTTPLLNPTPPADLLLVEYRLRESRDLVYMFTINSFNKYLMSAYYVPGTALGTADSM